MADIEIIYRKGYCELEERGYGHDIEYDIGCHECWAEDSNCKYFAHPEPLQAEDGTRIIPFGDCAHAKFEYRYKGWSGKRYEMEEYRDPYNSHLDSMLVKLGKTEYNCVKVIMNGKCIFNEYDEEGKA